MRRWFAAPRRGRATDRATGRTTGLTAGLTTSVAAMICLAITCTLALNACDDASGPPGGGPIRLTLGCWSRATTAEFQTLATEFHQANPSVTIQLKEYDAKTYDTQMLSDLSAGRAPDVYAQKNLLNFYAYSSANQLLDVTDITGQLAGKVQGLNNYAVDGHTYAVPYRQDSWVLFYNRDLFDRAKVAYPDGSWTWDDYDRVAKQLTKGLHRAGSDALGAYQHPWQSTVQGFALAQTPQASLISGDFSYLRPYYQRALDLQRSGAQVPITDAIAKGTTYQGQFGRQHAAMMLMGSWYIGSLVTQRANGDADTFNWGLAPAPQLSAGTTGRSKTPVTFGDPTALGINAAIAGQADKVAAAKAFLAYAAGPQGATALARVGITPADNASGTATFFGLAGMPTDDLSRYAFSIHETVPENPVSKYTAGLQSVLNELHTAIMSGNKDIDTAINDAQSAAKRILPDK